MERFRKAAHSAGMKRLLLGLYLLEFLGIFVLLMWKCRYGFGEADESFWLTVSRRFLQGDRMLLHEWHLSQFGFFTMIPEMWLYQLTVGTTEGMILNFRYIYTVCWCAGSFFLYLRARRISEYGARCASLFLMCFAPFGIMGFSYNSLCILYLTNAAVFLMCARRHQKAQFTISGVFFAGAVLCCPYLMAVYVIYSAALGIAVLRKKNPVISTNGAACAVCWRYFTLGAGILAVIFLTALFAGADPAQVMDSLGHALTDAEHSEFSAVQKTTDYFRFLASSNAFFWPMLITAAAMAALTLFRRNAVWFCIVCAAVILYLRRFLQEFEYMNMNYMMLPLTFAGLYVMAVTRDRRIRWVGGMWLIPGIVYTYCLNYSSNQEFYAVCTASAVSSVAALLMMWMYCGELRARDQARGKGRGLWRAAYAAVLICFAFQMRYEIPIRLQSVYWEAGLMSYEVQQEIDEGPQKGIIATVEKAERYETLYHDILPVENEKLLILSEEVWLYLANENEMSTYSGWLWRVNDYAMGRLREYYGTQPEKKPEIIFLDQRFDGVLSWFDPAEYDIRRLPSGNYFLRPIG